MHISSLQREQLSTLRKNKGAQITAYIPRLIGLMLLGFVLMMVALPVHGQDAAKEACTGSYKGRTITQEALEKVLEDHAKWIKTKKTDGKQANLCEAELPKLNLAQADLREANLEQAKLQQAHLAEADLRKANLAGVDLREANLAGADLREANLVEADLRKANLAGADLREANLERAKLQQANLARAKLTKANLDGSNLTFANLTGTNFNKANLVEATLNRAQLEDADLSEAFLSQALLRGADLTHANLIKAELIKAELIKAILTKAKLNSAILRGANLKDAKLTGANLNNADLTQAKLINTDLKDAELTDAKLARAIFEPRAGSLPQGASLFFGSEDKGGKFDEFKGLNQLKYEKSSRGLRELREAYKTMGMRLEERAVTYALKHQELSNANPVEKSFSYIFLELTCGYGLYPWRPLKILIVLTLIFALPYVVALQWSTHDRAWIWVVWHADRVRQDEGDEKPKPVTLDFILPKLQSRAAGRYVIFPLVGLYFSLLSACHVGWQDLDIGAWIRRIQPREYSLRATGWVRSVAGIQALISVYLLALWVLTYFGRPFE